MDEFIAHQTKSGSSGEIRLRQMSHQHDCSSKDGIFYLSLNLALSSLHMMTHFRDNGESEIALGKETAHRTTDCRGDIISVK
jgi:hypothetical protein